MVDLDLRPERRAGIADAVVEAVRQSIASGEVQLRGSLATGQADRYSDIDLLWSVPVERFAEAVERLPEVLSAVAPVASVRSDPDFERSRHRRVFFIRLVGVPLFWRIDLEVRASSWTEEDADGSGAPAESTQWSKAASALANGVAVVKAVLRGNPVEARGLLERGLNRTGESMDPREGWAEAVVRLARSAAALEPEIEAHAAEVSDLAVSLLPPGAREAGSDH